MRIDWRDTTFRLAIAAAVLGIVVSVLALNQTYRAIRASERAVEISETLIMENASLRALAAWHSPWLCSAWGVGDDGERTCVLLRGEK